MPSYPVHQVLWACVLNKLLKPGVMAGVSATHQPPAVIWIRLRLGWLCHTIVLWYSAQKTSGGGQRLFLVVMFPQFRNCAAQIRNFQFAQLFINCAKHRIICKLPTHGASDNSVSANEARGRLSSALERRYGLKKLRRLKLRP